MNFSDRDALLLIGKIISIAIFFETLELIQLRHVMREQGVWNWSLIKKDFEIFSKPIQKIFSTFLGHPQFLWILFIRLLAAFLFFLTPHPALLFLLFITTILGCLRWRGTIHGGSDFMTLIILMALCLASLFEGSPKVRLACLWYISIQLCTSYFIAGAIKLKRSNWRSGKALQGILSTTIYGPSPNGNSFIRHPLLALCSSWLLMVFECSFPISLLHPNLCIALICLAFVFHLANVYILGLNRFLWAWCAAYPALYYCSTISI